MSKKSTKGAHIKRALARSTYITTAWNWFMILVGKAAEPVLVASVLYASVKLLPVVHFPPQADVVVFIVQFVALDIGGLSLNKLADQAKQDGNEEGATQAKRLSLALVAVMLVGVIMASVAQIIKIEGQVGAVIDTILLIARAVMAVLYSRVIHSLKKDDEPEPPTEEKIETIVTEQVDKILSERLAEFSTRQGGVITFFRARIPAKQEKQLVTSGALKKKAGLLKADASSPETEKRGSLPESVVHTNFSLFLAPALDLKNFFLSSCMNCHMLSGKNGRGKCYDPKKKPGLPGRRPGLLARARSTRINRVRPTRSTPSTLYAGPGIPMVSSSLP